MAKEAKPDWVKMKPAELEKIIVDLAKQGETQPKIGIILRDKYGIPKAKLLGKKISEILAEAKVEAKSEESLANSKVDNLKKHIEKHKADHSAKRSLSKTQWRIYGLKAYAKQ